MKVEFTRNFEKQLDHLRDKSLKDEIARIVLLVINSKSLEHIPNLKKLKGFKSAYRIRTGNYRIGIVFQNGTVYFMAFAHRKDIYRIFP
ncbi:MAG: type II toxin-antitoxin system RelE family toxin [Bacteroidia bacterium]